MSEKTRVQEVSSEEEYRNITDSIPTTALTVLYFQAPWAEPCKQMSTVLDTLASTYPITDPPKIAFLSIDAEELPDISEEHDVTAVPFFVLRKDNSTLDTISGSDAQQLRSAVEKHAGAGTSTASAQLPPAQQVTRPETQPINTNHSAADPTQPKTSEGANGAGSAKTFGQYAPDSADPSTAPDYSGNTKPTLNTNTPNTNNTDEKSSDDLEARLTQLTNAAPAMLFMKGTPSAPQCGFSRQLVSILRENNVRYGFFNILADDEVRQGLKEFSEWPTFPQLYLKGELVGGLDIVKEELESDPSYFEEFAAKKASQGGMAGAQEQKAA